MIKLETTEGIESDVPDHKKRDEYLQRVRCPTCESTNMIAYNARVIKDVIDGWCLVLVNLRCMNCNFKREYYDVHLGSTFSSFMELITSKEV